MEAQSLDKDVLLFHNILDSTRFSTTPPANFLRASGKRRNLAAQSLTDVKGATRTSRLSWNVTDRGRDKESGVEPA